MEIITFIIIIFILYFIYSKPKRKYKNKHSKEIYSYKKDSSTLRKKINTTDLSLISAEEKSKYLQSDKWKRLKEIRLIIDDHCCAKCHSTNNLQLHHITYARLTEEDLSDVVILCDGCHSALHERLGYDRTTIYHID